MVTSREYRLGVLRGIYVRHLRSRSKTMSILIKTRTELLAYTYLAKRGFISMEQEDATSSRFNVSLLHAGIDYIESMEVKQGITV
ncbi:hypothetical protein [Aneurinibacillus aneurinilyticus]|uniref:Uncharacterized protein n=1 Tax=Aneurinibacillus aneurinilyticus TaxID=1391 RepID=A0A848CXK9_ANEAE|nr:hypothetical protein [Aneurinibacillus aneurinilyticus]NMF00186.1 hypothetical protein [Aneurinibacillus aneurinilyticus]